jgi:hypothetical protein
MSSQRWFTVQNFHWYRNQSPNKYYVPILCIWTLLTETMKVAKRNINLEKISDICLMDGSDSSI